MAHKIIFLDRDSLAPGTVVRKAAFKHIWVDHAETALTEVSARIADATIVVTNKVPITASDMDAAPGLKMIAICATGSDHIDLGAARDRNIIVSNVRGYAVHSVPEHVFGLILTLRRQILGYLDDLKNGRWQAEGTFTFFSHELSDLHGSGLGIVGRGSLGQSVAQIARGFGMNVTYAGRKGDANPPEPYISFDEMIETADVITLHCPLTPETRNLVAMAEFKRMKPSALIINTARGGLIHEDDLAAALKNDLIAGAGIDVVSSEPPPLDHPFMGLLGRPNFILTPHTAWAGNTARKGMVDQLIDNIEHFVKGQPRNVL